MHNFERLKIWQKAMDITVEVYKISELLPNDERFNSFIKLKNVPFQFLQILPKDLEGITTKNLFSF